MARRRGIRSALRRLFAGGGDRQGTALVEFSLLFPSFMLVTYGVIEFARVLFVQAILFYAAEEATRYAAVHYNADAAEIRAVTESKMILIDPDKITDFNIIADINPVDKTKLVTVEISYSFEPILPIGWTTIKLFGHSRGFIVID